MQNLIGPIVKNAEIFHKNIFIPFFHVVLGPKRFLGGLPHSNRKSKKIWPDQFNIYDFFTQKKLGVCHFAHCWSRQG